MAVGEKEVEPFAIEQILRVLTHEEDVGKVSGVGANLIVTWGRQECVSGNQLRVSLSYVAYK